MSEQKPSVGGIAYYLDGKLFRVVEDDDIDGVVALGEGVIDLTEGASACDEGNMYKDIRHWPGRV